MSIRNFTQRLEEPNFHNRMQARYERSLRWCNNLIAPPEVAVRKNKSAATSGGSLGGIDVPQANKSPTVMQMSPIRANG